jgi:hypothetical protein
VPGLAHHLLMLYGPDIPNFFRRAVSYADKLRIRSATINLQTSMLLAYGQQIAASALEKRLPTVYGYREHVIAGGLISYGVDLRWCYYRAAYFVDRILHGRLLATCRSSFRRDVFGGQFENRNRIGSYGAAGATHHRRRGD